MSAKICLISLILVMFSAGSLVANAAITTKIVGGKPSVSGQWPWIVALVRNFDADGKIVDNFQGQFCGGSLISPTWVVTAAHCLEKVKAGSIHVVSQVTNLKNDRGQNTTVKRIIMHPQFNSKTVTNDIALLQLQKPITNVKTLALINGSSLLVNMSASVIGWGALSQSDSNASRYPEFLSHAGLPIISNNVCKQAMDNNTPITDTLLCAGFNNARTDTCQGDSGGPLVVKLNNQWYLAGITSWGSPVGCATPGFYGVYTRVSKYVSYINSTIKTNFVALADVNHDKVVNALDKTKKNSDLKTKFQIWLKQCWSAKASCANVNADSIINVTDYQIQNKRVADDYKYWLEFYWQPEATQK